jgi:hypothetical protein
MVLGLIALGIGGIWSVIAERQFRFWLCSEHYVEAEFEVTRFYPKPRDSHARCQIEGVVHPGGDRVVTTDRDIAIKQYNGPEDRFGHEPSPAELEGKRLAVIYWPPHPESHRWWHPPSIASRGTIRSGSKVLSDLLFAAAFVSVGLFWCLRGARNLKATVRPSRAVDQAP